MVHMLTHEEILAALAPWQLSEPITITKIPDGYQGVVWSVVTPQQRYIAKLAYERQGVFEFGLRISELVEQHGILAGPPLRTPEGQLSIMVEYPPTHFHPFALLHVVPGEPLDWSAPQAPVLVAQALALLHRIPFVERPAPANDPLFAYICEQTEEVNAQAGLSELIQQVVDAVRGFESKVSLTYGLTYGDDLEFLYDHDMHRVGLIDWGTAGWGHCLYDIALAIEQFRGSGASEYCIEQFIASYRAICPLSSEEIAGVKYYTALRLALLAKFFSWRLAHNINAHDDPDDNACSLMEIRAELEKSLYYIKRRRQT